MNHVWGKPQRNLTINVIVARFYDPPASKLYLFGFPKYATPSCKHSTVSIDFITWKYVSFFQHLDQLKQVIIKNGWIYRTSVNSTIKIHFRAIFLNKFEIIVRLINNSSNSQTVSNIIFQQKGKPFNQYHK